MKPTYKMDIEQNNYAFNHGSRLVYGCSGLGGVWGETDYRESVECLLYAFEEGISSLDTSPSYNQSETVIGKALKQWKGPRPFVSTKVGRLQSKDAHTTVVDYTPKSMTISLHESLEKLGLESVDLLFLHEPQLVPIEKMDEIIACLQDFKSQGLVKMLGIGGNPTFSFLPFVRKKNFEVVSGFLKMDACNLSAFDIEIPRVKEEGMAYYAASPLHFSLLGNRYEQYIKTQPNEEWVNQKDFNTAIKVNNLAKRIGIELPSLAQRYLFSMNEANRVVIGARKLNQIIATLEDWKEGALEENIFNEITTIIQTE